MCVFVCVLAVRQSRVKSVSIRDTPMQLVIAGKEVIVSFATVYPTLKFSVHLSACTLPLAVHRSVCNSQTKLFEMFICSSIQRPGH